MSIKKIFICVFIFILFATGCLAYFVFYTSKGSKVAIDTVLNQYVTDEQVSYKSLEGHLAEGVTFENLELKELKYFPKGTVLMIQALIVNADALNIQGVTAEIRNGRLKMPNSDTIVINGSFQDGNLNINVYGNTVDLGDIFDIASVKGFIRKIAGEISNVDAYIKGHYKRPVVTGELHIKELSYDQFSLKEAPTQYKLQLKDISNNMMINGKIDINKGKVLSRRTTVSVEPSSIIFDGQFDNPRFNISAEASVEKTKINILIKGTKDNPDLWLSSQPPLPKAQLMVMLATGKRWQGVENSLQNEQLTDDVADDFVDFFVFSGQGKKVADALGVKELSIVYTEESRGIGVRKSITDKLDIGYGIEKTVEDGQEPSRVKQKLEGEYSLNEKLSIGVQKEIMYDKDVTEEDTTVPETTGDDRIFMKFKTKF